MSRSTIPPKGMQLIHVHQHACGHWDECSLEYYAKTTGCKRCRAARFNEQKARDREAAS